MEKVESLDPQQRNHMRVVVEKLIECYLDAELHGVLVIGNEANGISAAVLQHCTKQISIPPKGQAESLNAAMACGILTSYLFR